MACNFIIERRRDKKTGEIKVDNVPINADINIKGVNVRYFTGYRIDASRWVDIKRVDEETGELIVKQEVKKNAYGKRGKESVQYNIINNDLAIIRSAVLNIEKNTPIDRITKTYIVEQVDEALNKRKIHSASDIDTSFWGLYNVFIESQEKTGKAGHGRIKSYINARTNLKNFEKFVWKRKIEFADCNGAMMEEFDYFMQTDGNINGRYEHLSPKERPRAKGLNTRIRIMKVLCAFFKWVDSQYGIIVSAFKEYKIGEEKYEDPYFLTIEERDTIINHTFSNDKLNLVRDIFTFHAFVGARITDFYDLTTDNLSDDGNYIEYIADKTIKENPKTIRVPLRPEVKEIIKKYGCPEGRLFPYIPKQDYNDCLKQLLIECNIMRKVSVLNKLTMKEEKRFLFEVISSHNIRKTFIAALKRKKVQDSTIVSMSGHQPNTKALSRYYAVADDEKQEALDSI